MVPPLPIAALPPGWLAAGLIDVIGPLLVVAFWVIRQVLVGLKEQRELDKARKEAEERGEPWPPVEEAAPVEAPIERPVVQEAKAPALPKQTLPKPAQVDLRSEVEEFLRRAAQGAAGPAPAPQPAPKPPLDPFDEPPRRKRPKSAIPQAKAPKTKANKPGNFNVPRSLDIEADSPAPPVALRRLPESQLAENAAHLGENIATADERVEARLHEKFDHRLGNLTSRPSDSPATTAEPASAAGRIRRALVAPGGAREAVILSEILRSPADRL